MKRVVITGATGFVGANLARRCLHEGHEVHLLLRPEHDAWRIEGIRDDVRLHIVELSDREALSSLVQRIRPEWIFHLAAHGAYPAQTDLGRMIETNIVGTVNLVEICLESGFEAFVNTGSSSEYGFKDNAPTEKEWLEPNSAYAVTKASASLFCRLIAQSRNVHLITLRLYSVYGPYEEPSRLMPTLIMKGLHGKLPSLANPEIARDYVYVDDVNQAYLLAAARPSQESGAIYNVGTGIQTSLREVVETARRVMNITVEPEWGSMPDRQWDTTAWVSNNLKIQSALGWRPEYPFETGFRQMVNWFKDHPRAEYQNAK
jgi:nucleoside-diphosphate-sugar epimerase